jgi:hypothetical protein
VLLGYFYNPKYRTYYSLLLGSLVGLAAYYFNPPETYDLYRHHILVDDASGQTLTSFLSAVSQTSEPIQALATYLVSQTHNHDLLQFSVVAIGYSILLFIIGDFAKRKNITKSSLLLVLLFTLTSFVYINFISGLWNSLAMLVFALAFYRDCFLKKGHIITYALFLITPLIHSSMVFPLALLIVHKLFKGKFNLKSLLVVVAIFIAPSVLLPIINYFTNIPIFAQLEPMYNSYFLNGAQFNNLYGGFVIPMEILKISTYVIVAMLYKPKENDEQRVRSFVLLLAVATILLAINGVVFFRFVLLVQFIGSMLLLLYFSQRSRIVLILSGCTIIIDGIFLLYQYMTLKNLNFAPLGIDSIFNNIIQLFVK